MVKSEWNQILDAGKKIYGDFKMGRDEHIELDALIKLKSSRRLPDKKIWDDDDECYITLDGGENPDYKEPTPIIHEWIMCHKRAVELSNEIGKSSMSQVRADLRNDMLEDKNKKNALYRYIDKTPFHPCVMINISPDWKGKIDPRNKRYQQLLKHAIKLYLTDCSRFTRWRFCLESGGNGDFLHAHIVAEINPDQYKSVMTQINKGNYARSLRKYWKSTCTEMGIEGIGGILEGKYSIQRIIIRNETMRDDKLAYLHEENKPTDHKNQYDLNRVIGDF